MAKLSELRKWFEANADEEHLEFDRIPAADRLHPSHKLCGLLKVASLMRDPARFSVAAEHDEVMLPGHGGLRSDVTEADAIYLLRCGVFWSDERDCLMMYC